MQSSNDRLAAFVCTGPPPPGQRPHDRGQLAFMKIAFPLHSPAMAQLAQERSLSRHELVSVVFSSADLMTVFKARTLCFSLESAFGAAVVAPTAEEGTRSCAQARRRRVETMVAQRAARMSGRSEARCRIARDSMAKISVTRTKTGVGTKAGNQFFAARARHSAPPPPASRCGPTPNSTAQPCAVPLGTERRAQGMRFHDAAP